MHELIIYILHVPLAALNRNYCQVSKCSYKFEKVINCSFLLHTVQGLVHLTVRILSSIKVNSFVWKTDQVKSVIHWKSPSSQLSNLIYTVFTHSCNYWFWVAQPMTFGLIDVKLGVTFPEYAQMHILTVASSWLSYWSFVALKNSVL